LEIKELVRLCFKFIYFGLDYHPYEIVKQPHHVPEEYKPKQEKIDLGTTYKRDFNSFKVQPVAIVRPLERQQVKKGRLDTVPTYKDDYRAYDLHKSELYKPEQTFHPPTDDFVPQEIKPRQIFETSSVVKRSTAPFNGITSHRLDYIPHQLELKFERPKEVCKPTDQRFEDLTTHQYDFQGLIGETAKICRPVHTRVTQNDRFEGSTEFHECFQPWEIPPPEVKKVPDMLFNITSHLNYVPYQANCVVPIRPVSHRRSNNFPFQGKSTMKEVFPAWENCHQGLIKKQEQIPNPSGKFDGLSTFRSHYVPHKLIPTESCKPLNIAFKSSVPFDDVTIYSEICPASYSSPPGYIFENASSQGHKFFCKISPAVKAF
uniref:Stabilizer of axonemal microtubules 2 n=1 Tax=Cercocebus atys TaxID=9531 RepID=A0A2K5NRS4_CERAT